MQLATESAPVTPVAGFATPDATLARDNPDVTSATGVWERHILAEVFGVDDPRSERLDCAVAPLRVAEAAGEAALERAE